MKQIVFEKPCQATIPPVIMESEFFFKTRAKLVQYSAFQGLKKKFFTRIWENPEMSHL